MAWVCVCVYPNNHILLQAIFSVYQVFPLYTDKVQYSSSPAVAVCTTTDCTLSAFKLINALCVGSVENVRTLQELLTQLFYSGVPFSTPPPQYSMK